jgi:hypothetical protein
VCHKCAFLIDEVGLNELRVRMLTFAEFVPSPRCRDLRRCISSCSFSKLTVGRNGWTGFEDWLCVQDFAA